MRENNKLPYSEPMSDGCVGHNEKIDVSVVILIYNEIDSINPLYEKISSVFSQRSEVAEFIFVNDGSSDGSAAILDALATKDRRVKVIHFRRNFGQTAALVAGFHHSTGEVVIPMDGDLQNDPADIPRLLSKVDEGYDVVSGWRRDRRDREFGRKLPSRIANWLISKVTGVHLHDYGCTLKAYRAEVLDGVELYGEMHRFVPIFAAREGALITEIPVNHHCREFGKSKYGFGRIPRVILDLLLVWFLGKAYERPIHLFGMFGIYTFIGAFIAGMIAIYFKFSGLRDFVETPLPLLVVLLLLSGIILVLMGLLAEMLSRTYFASSNRTAYRIRRKLNFDESGKSGLTPPHQVS